MSQAFDVHVTNPSRVYVFIRTEALAIEFRDVIQRGLNCFPNASPEMKTLGDLLTSGIIMQDYYRMENSNKTDPD